MSSWSRRAAGAAAITAALAAATTPGAQAQEAALNWDNYDPVVLTTDVAEPIDLAVMPDLKVLHTARNGQIRLTDPVAGTTKVINSFDVYTSGEQGMQTVSLDPDFANNRWVYLYYAPTKMEAPYPRAGADGQRARPRCRPVRPRRTGIAGRATWSCRASSGIPPPRRWI